jgi:hypothetical protein
MVRKYSDTARLTTSRRTRKSSATPSTNGRRWAPSPSLELNPLAQSLLLLICLLGRRNEKGDQRPLDRNSPA